jgi:hypothetical protein
MPSAVTSVLYVRAPSGLLQHRTVQTRQECVGHNACCVADCAGCLRSPKCLLVKDGAANMNPIHDGVSSHLFVINFVSHPKLYNLSSKNKFVKWVRNKSPIIRPCGLIQNECHIREISGKIAVNSSNMYIKFSGHEIISFKWTWLLLWLNLLTYAEPTPKSRVFRSS